MKKEFIKSIKFLLLGVVVFASISSASAAGVAGSWVGPTATAPNGNVYGPINIGPSNQTKQGLFAAGNLYSNNNIFAGPNSFSQNYPGNLTGGSVSSTWFCLPIDTTGGSSGTGAIGFIKKIISANFVDAATTNPSANADCITKWADILTNNNILSLPTGTILGQTLYWDTTAPAKWKVNNIFKVNPTTNVASVTGKLDVSSDVTLNGNITAPTLASKTLCTDATGKFIACAGGTANPGGVLPLGTSEGQTLYWSNTTPVQWKANNVLSIDTVTPSVKISNGPLIVDLTGNSGSSGRDGIYIQSSLDNTNTRITTNRNAFQFWSTQNSANADIIGRDYVGRGGTFSSLVGGSSSNVCADNTGKLIVCP